MKTKLFPYISILVTAALLAACGAQPNPGSTGSGGSQAGAGSGPCDNPLYPIQVGNTWNYQDTGTASTTFTRTIIEVTDNGFTDQDTFPGPVTRNGQWSCSSGNLTSLAPSPGASAEVQSSGTSSDLQTTDLTGVTLPASIQAGDTWSQHMLLQGSTEISGVAYQSSTEVTMNCTAAGNESVTATAGTFNAMKITCQMIMDITFTIDGTAVPSTWEFTSDSWYAPGVGMVRTVYTGGDIDSTIDLVSYTLP